MNVSWILGSTNQFLTDRSWQMREIPKSISKNVSRINRKTNGPFSMGVNHLAFTYGFFSTPKRIWVNFGTPKTHGGVHCSTGPSRHIPWLLLVLQNPKARPWLCLAPGDGADGAHLTMMKSRDVMLSSKYKIQFCCHTNLFGEWPSNVMLDFEKTANTASESDFQIGAPYGSPMAPSFSPICRAYLTRRGRTAWEHWDHSDMAIRSPTAEWDAPLQEGQHALNFFHCTPCSSQQKLRGTEGNLRHFHNEHEH